MRDKNTKLITLMKTFQREKIQNLIVTLGGNGSILYNYKKNKIFHADAYAKNIVDKIGAGDTMLSLIAPCLKSKIDIELSLLISSLAAAHSVENIGNKNSIKKIDILKNLENILK